MQYLASFCVRLAKDIFSYQSLLESYRNIESSFTNSYRQQRSFSSFVVNGKPIADGTVTHVINKA
jgi:hypothetical protein